MRVKTLLKYLILFIFLLIKKGMIIISMEIVYQQNILMNQKNTN